MKKILVIFCILIFVNGCGGGSSGNNSGDSNTKPDINNPVNPADPINNNPVTPPVKSSAKTITEFQFLPENNPGITTAIQGEINNTTITLKIPATSNISGLVASFKASDRAVVMTATGIQTSGLSSNNFNVPVQYYVKAEDESISIYNVIVIADPASNIAGWPKTFGGSLADEAKGITTDTAGNIFVVGYFRNSVDFDPGPNIDLKNSNGSADIFISKFNKDGSYAWTKTFGGSGEDRAESISLDKEGNILITGLFNNIVDFNPGSESDIKNAIGHNNYFITKLYSDGSYAWTNIVENKTAIKVSSTTTPSNIEYVAVTLDSGIVSLISFGNNQAVLTKKIVMNSVSECMINTDYLGNIFMIGTFFGTADFNPEGGHEYITSAGSSDIFITKLNPDGSYAWTKTFGGLGEDKGRSLTTDYSGNIYFTGSFSRAVDFDPSLNQDIKVDSSDNSYIGDVFVTKLNFDGSYAWTKTFEGSYSDCGNAITINTDGNIVITGLFTGRADFDPKGSHDYKNTNGRLSSSNPDIFISTLSPAGNYITTKTFGGQQEDIPNSIVVDHDGNIFITGFFNDSADFDPSENEDIKNSQGFKDIFILKTN